MILFGVRISILAGHPCDECHVCCVFQTFNISLFSGRTQLWQRQTRISVSLCANHQVSFLPSQEYQRPSFDGFKIPQCLFFTAVFKCCEREELDGSRTCSLQLAAKLQKHPDSIRCLSFISGEHVLPCSTSVTLSVLCLF